MILSYSGRISHILQSVYLKEQAVTPTFFRLTSLMTNAFLTKPGPGAPWEYSLISLVKNAMFLLGN